VANQDTVVLPTGSQNKTNCPTDSSIEDAYAMYDMRESYMQRHLSPLASQAEATELNTKDFHTKSCNMWKSDDLSLYPEAQNSVSGSKNIYKEKVSFNFFRSDHLRHIDLNLNSFILHTWQSK